MKINIDKKLLPMKGHYFLFNAGVSPVQPFMPVIAKDLKFSKSAVGVINGILPFTGMFAKPIFGAIADRFRLHKLTFICFQILTIIGFFNIQFIPEIEQDSGGKVKLVCGAETNFDLSFKETNKNVDCYIKKLLSETDKTMKCSLRCDLSPELRTELCGPWKANPSICTEDISSKATVAEYEHVMKDEKEPGSGSLDMSPLDSVKLEFIASVPLRHTLQVANTLYFRVADAQLNDETHHVPYCKNETHTYCKIHCDDPTMAAILTSNEQSDSSFVNHYQFWVFLFLAVISWVGMAVVGSVADAVCFEMLGEKASQYGRQRLFGSIGWGIFAFISGLLVDSFSKGGETNYTPSFYLMLVLIGLDVYISYNLKYEQTKISPNLLKNVGKLLSDVWIDVFLVWCIIVGMCVGIQWTYLFWYLEELFGDPESCEENFNKKTLFGLVSGVQCFLGELPFFFVYGWVVKKLGHVNLMTLIPFLIGIRFILYSVLSNPWWILPIEVLQGSVGLTFATLASYASVVAPPGAEATTQGLVGAIFEGIGVSLGSYVGGLIYEAYNGSVLFQTFAVVAFGLSLLHGAFHFLVGKTNKLQSNEFNGIAKYATPNDAVSMLEDT